ncbi:MAG: OmpA family protein, partial [Planctomycetota bacterium]
PLGGNGQPATLFGQNQNGFFNSPRTASNNNSFFGGLNRRNPRQIQTNTPREFQEYSQLSQEIQSLNQRLGSFDSDNQQLVTEIASLKQKLQVASDYNNQIKQQLADTSVQFQQMQVQKQNVEQQLADAMQQVQNNQQLASMSGNAPTGLLGAATVRSNNSLLQKLSSIRIPGGQARMDGDVIRVEFPSDNLFNPGTYNIRADQNVTMRNIVTTISNSFPNQIIGIEAHWDGTPLNPPTTTHHQLTATQSIAVFNRLVQQGLSANQLFTMAMGSNRPRHPNSNINGISPNRRVEIVIYPEKYNSN